jgi:hypothetical protein
VRYGPLPEPVRFVGCDDLVDAVASILRGWDVRDVAPEGLPRPVIRVRRIRRGYRRVSCWRHTPTLAREKVRRTLTEALCGFHFEFIDWYVAHHPDLLYVHGAAVQYGERLVLFPALAKAGKSTLTVRLAAEGLRVFCDDVLPIDPPTRRGIALGIVPRLRPPLPPDMSPSFRRFVDGRRGHAYVNRLYVTLRDGEIAPLGETAPVGGVVLLERSTEGAASLRRVDPAEALERVILQNFAGALPARGILDALADVVLGAECGALRYVRTEEAVRLLDGAFGPWRRRAGGRKGSSR